MTLNHRINYLLQTHFVSNHHFANAFLTVFVILDQVRFQSVVTTTNSNLNIFSNQFTVDETSSNQKLIGINMNNRNLVSHSSRRKYSIYLLVQIVFFSKLVNYFLFTLLIKFFTNSIKFSVSRRLIFR